MTCVTARSLPSGSFARTRTLRGADSARRADAERQRHAAVRRAGSDIASHARQCRRREGDLASVVLCRERHARGRFLDLHAGRVRRISERTARIAWVVEQAAGSDSEIAELWERMAKNRRRRCAGPRRR